MVTKEEIAQNEQFLLLSPCFQLYSIIVLSFKGIFHRFSGMFSKSSAADLLYVEKGLITMSVIILQYASMEKTLLAVLCEKQH